MKFDPVQQWMVKQNVEYAKTEGLDVVVARLKANGYLRVADAVEAAIKNSPRDE